MVVHDSKDIGLYPLDGLFKMDYMDWQVEKVVPEHMLQINPIENNTCKWVTSKPLQKCSKDIGRSTSTFLAG